MARLDEDVRITDTVPASLDAPEQRGKIADELIDSLVELHGTDWTTLGLEGFGKPTGYLERQLRRFNGLWEVNRTREISELVDGAKLVSVDGAGHYPFLTHPEVFNRELYEHVDAAEKGASLAGARA